MFNSHALPGNVWGHGTGFIEVSITEQWGYFLFILESSKSLILWLNSAGITDPLEESNSGLVGGVS